MRVLLALLALVGLLLSPAAASAAAVSCLHHHRDGQMLMAMDAAQPGHMDPAGEHECCDDEREQPAQHDGKACAQACAVMCGVSVAMPEAPAEQPLAARLAPFHAPRARALRGHAPPGPDHPPKLSI